MKQLLSTTLNVSIVMHLYVPVQVDVIVRKIDVHEGDDNDLGRVRGLGLEPRCHHVVLFARRPTQKT